MSTQRFHGQTQCCTQDLAFPLAQPLYSSPLPPHSGFKDQIYDVFKFLPENVQCCLFSATMPLDILEITTRFMRDPIRILVKRDELTLEGN